MNFIFNTLSSLLLFMMIFFPMTYQKYKIIIIGFLTIGMIGKLVKYDIKISKKVYLWYSILIIYGLIWGYYGLMKGNPGANDFIRLNVFWVLIYFLYTIFIDKKILYILVNTIVYSTFLISVYNILSVLDKLGWITFGLYNYLDTGTRIGIHPGYIQITTHNIASLTYTVPFVIVVYIMSYSKYKINISKKILFITMILSLVTVLLSGRRALMIAIILIPFLIIPVCYILNIIDDVKKGIKIYLGIFTIIIVIALMFILLNLSVDTISLYIQRFLGAFDSSEQNERIVQFEMLMSGFAKNPIIGSGPGIGVDYIRSIESPWIYELSYVQQLYNTGILGMMIYIILIIYMYIKILFITYKRKQYSAISIPLIVGMTSFLIANATNPYLAKYDHMWTIFLTISFINICSIERSNEYNA